MSCKHLVAAAVLAAAALAVPAQAQLANRISHQGKLESGGAPASGSFDVRFRLFTTAGGAVQVGPTLTRTVAVASDGTWTVNDLDFGAGSFNGQDRYLDIQVKPTAGVLFTQLSPRQAVVSAPTARYAQASGTGLNQAYLNGNAISVTGLPLQVGGPLEILNGPTPGRLTIQTTPSTSASMQVSDFAGLGPFQRMANPAGNIMYAFEPDIDGGGAFSVWYSNLGVSGGFVQIDGNAFGSGSPIFSLFGSNSGTSINGDAAGDGSATFSADAISSGEILDEPGVAHFDIDFLGTSLSGGVTTNVASRSITVPDEGFVLVLAMAEVFRSHTNGTSDFLTYGIGTTPTGWDRGIEVPNTLPASAPSGSYDLTLTTHQVFRVPSAGTYTYYWNLAGGGGSHQVSDVAFTVVYLPTAYGAAPALLAGRDEGSSTNTSDVARVSALPVRGGLSAVEITAEQTAERQRALAELQAKQASMQAEMEALREQIAREMARQHAGGN